MGRLGTLDELAHLALPFVDGTSRFTTGQFVAFAGGWVWTPRCDSRAAQVGIDGPLSADPAG